MGRPRGLTLLELLVVMLLITILVGIATPSLNRTRLAMGFGTAQEQVVAALNRARWMAMTSGRPSTVIELTSPIVLSISDGGAVLSSVDVSDYGVTMASGEFPVTLESRGMQPGGETKTLTLTSAVLGRSVTISVGPLGKVEIL